MAGFRSSLAPPSGVTVRPASSTITAFSSGAASTAQRRPPSQAPEVTSERAVGMVSAVGPSVTTGAGGGFSPHADASSAAANAAWGRARMRGM